MEKVIKNVPVIYLKIKDKTYKASLLYNILESLGEVELSVIRRRISSNKDIRDLLIDRDIIEDGFTQSSYPSFDKKKRDLLLEQLLDICYYDEDEE